MKIVGKHKADLILEGIKTSNFNNLFITQNEFLKIRSHTISIGVPYGPPIVANYDLMYPELRRHIK